MTHLLARSDARRIPLPDGSVQCVVTSPPYLGLRDYGIDGQIGLEGSIDGYLDAMRAVFRELWRVLRDDGTVWLNIGDSYASGEIGRNDDDPRNLARRASLFGTGTIKPGDHVRQTRRVVRPNAANCFESFAEGRPVVVGDATTIRVTSQSVDVPVGDEVFPYGKLLSLLGLERVLIKKRDDDLGQVFHTLASPCYCRIAVPVRSATRDGANLEIVLDDVDDARIVVTQHDPDAEPVFGILGACGAWTGEDDESPLAVEQPGEPVAEGLDPTREHVLHPVPLDAPGERLPDVYLVDEPIPLGDRLGPAARDAGDFGVADALAQPILLALGRLGVNVAPGLISHVRILNEHGSLVHVNELYGQAIRKANTLRSKQELGIPDLLKRALMEEGWICRSTIIWSKPNPMPESVTDRPTKAHEQVFLLAKSERYFFDAEAVREKITDRHNSIGTNNVIRSGLMDGKVLGRESNVHGGLGDWEQNPAGRNVRSVWSISSEAFPGSHFAVMPRKLVEPCVKAGTSQAGCCPACGRAWERVTERESQVEAGHARGHNAAYCEGRAVNGASIKKWLSRDLGFRQSCQCEPAPPVPCLVLDCFGGAQTVGVVATGLGRRYVGFDLNPEYLAMGRRRIERPHSQVRKVEKKHPLFASLEDAS